MKVPLRFKVLFAWLARMVNRGCSAGDISFPELLRYLSQPSKYKRGMAWVNATGLDEKGDAWYDLKNWKHRVYYPKGMSSDELLASVHLIFDERDWHHYWPDSWRPNPEDIVLDCGAAEGLFSMEVAQLGAKVIAFEPLGDFHRVLEQNIGQFSNVELVRAAVGHCAARVSFGGASNGSKILANGEFDVEVVTVDQQCLEGGRVSMIKADIEGFEYDMLLGAEQLIRRDKPRLSLTVYHDQNNVPQIRDFLHRCHEGYTISTRGLEVNGNPVMLFALP